MPSSRTGCTPFTKVAGSNSSAETKLSRKSIVFAGSTMIFANG